MTFWKFESKKIVDKLGGELIHKKSVVINSAATISKAQDNSIMFVTSKKWKKKYLEKILNVNNAMIIIEPSVATEIKQISGNNQIIVCDNARLYFAKALRIIIEEERQERQYITEGSRVIGENVSVGKDCIIEPGVFIDHDVNIGDNVYIKTGVVIRSYVCIGNNVTIGENTVIGAQGFGVERDNNGLNVRIPHIGGVIIGNNVEVGALTSIVSGTIEPTIIQDNCFIDDLNHIAHNCFIGKSTMTTACVQIGGSAKIGSSGYIAPNSTIRNGISIGECCFIGQASSVQQDFGDNKSIVGNPSREFIKK